MINIKVNNEILKYFSLHLDERQSYTPVHMLLDGCNSVKYISLLLGESL